MRLTLLKSGAKKLKCTRLKEGLVAAHKKSENHAALLVD